MGCLSIDSKPSLVDFSSLEQIKNYPMYSLEELNIRFEKLNYIEGIRNFNGHVWKGDIGRSWVYSYDSQGGEVYLWIYDNSDNAKNNFEKWEKNSHKRLRKNIVKISEDIDIILWNSDPIRDEYFSYIYDVLYTSIRIGNIIITLDERFYRNEHEHSGKTTTMNIEMICQLLM